MSFPSPTTTLLIATCHCNAIKLTFPVPTKALNECQCSICRRYGALWAYVQPEDIKIEGEETEFYMWQDKDIQFHRCKKCGCVTHTVPAHKDTRQAITVNCRMLEREDLGRLEAKKSEGPA